MSDQPAFCRTERRDRVLIVTLQRPEVGNALHAPAHRELAGIFDEFAADDALHVAILTGAGTTFCEGADYEYAGAAADASLPSTGFGGLTSRFDLPKPIIAAVNGPALSEGFELALACDLIVAEETAHFAMAQPRYGRVAANGGMHRLAREVPLKKAMAALLTGKQISAAEGVLLGFVNELAPRMHLMSTAVALANQLLSCSPSSLRATKESVMTGLMHASIADAMKVTASIVERAHATEEAAEGLAARRENRLPHWAGRRS